MTASAQEPRTGRWAALKRRYEPQLDTLRGSDTAKAGGLAGAMIANNVLALISTVVFARLLTDYGSLAALISYFLILSVAGQALQIATAREGVLGHLGVGPGLIATLRRWTRSMLVFTAVVRSRAWSGSIRRGRPRSGSQPGACGSRCRSSAARSRAWAITRASASA
jgi:hypothetical protein